MKSSYSGEVRNCSRHGFGKYQYPGLDYKYEGNWVEGVKQKSGVFELPGLFVYEGEFLDGEITGYGVKRWADGKEYTGNWINGEMCGLGEWKNGSGTSSYKGGFLDNKRHGTGVLVNTDVDQYEGTFAYNRFSGQGIYLKVKKYSLNGSFDEGCVHGFAKAIWNKIATFEGEWSKGLPEGSGCYRTTDDSYIYKGEFLSGQPKFGSIRLKSDIDPASFSTRKRLPPSAFAAGKKPQGKEDPANNLFCFAKGEPLGNVNIYSLWDEPPVPPPVVEAPVDPKKKAATVAEPQEHVPQVNPLEARVFGEVNRKLSVSLIALTYDEIANQSYNTAPSLLPFWQKKKTLNSVAAAWERFPYTITRIIDGKNVVSGELGKISLVTPTGGVSDSDLTVGSCGVTGFNILLGHKVRYTYPSSGFTFASVGSERTDLSVLVDCRIDIIGVLTGLQTSSSACTDDDCNKDEICITVMSLESKGESVSVIVKCSRDDTGIVKLQEKIAEFKARAAAPPGADPLPVLEFEHFSSKVTWELRASDSTLLVRWSDPNFNFALWHSFVLSLRAVPVLEEEGTVSYAADFSVDGHGNMRASEGIDQAEESARVAALMSGLEGDDERTLIVCAGGQNFVGMCKSTAIFNKFDLCSVEETSSIFSVLHSEAGYSAYDGLFISLIDANAAVDPKTKAKAPAGNATAGKGIFPQQAECNVVTQCTVFSRGGKCELTDIVIPPTTSSGLYCLFIRDAANSAVIAENTTQLPEDHVSVLATALDEGFKLVKPLSFDYSCKFIVE